MAASLRVALGASLLAALASVPRATAQSLPADFVTQELGFDWVQPTCLCFAPPDDNRDLLVAEKSGLVWNVRDGLKRAMPVLDLSLEVLNNGDRGLLGIVADPNWDTNGWLYLLYVVDPNEDGGDGEQESFGRLTRYTTWFDVNGDLLADPASRLVLIGATWPEGIPSLHWSHSVGDLRFAVDGTLYVSTGDGAHYDFVDVGGSDPNGFGSGKFDASEDIGAFRSQSETSLAGKILRIDPATGFGLPDNPLWTGNGADNRSRIWAMGLRNPFRFALRPNTGSPGKLYVGDVGWGTWEEIDQNLAGGIENYGWPCWEGPSVESGYDSNDPSGWCDDPTIFKLPLHGYHHWVPGSNGYTGQCIAGLQMYTGLDYPQKWNGRLFYAEYSSDWIRTVRFVSGQPTDMEVFGTGMGNTVDLIADPVNGDLLYVAIGHNAVRRIRYTASNLPPVVVATATPEWGPSPLTVAFDGSGSYDPEGQTLSFLWEFGDGATDTNAVTSHVYPLGINYTAKLTVTDVGGETALWTELISVDNSPPEIVAIHSPPPGSFHSEGDVITFDASAVDAEDDATGIPIGAEWIIDLIHDHHTHPGWTKLPGLTVDWTFEGHGDGTYYKVKLKLTDSRKLTDLQSFELYDADETPHPHLDWVSDVSPRLGVPLEVRGHLHYPGKGDGRLVFDWGDGGKEVVSASHMEDFTFAHDYVAPGLYTLKLKAGDLAESETVEQTILVRPLHPSVAIFVPLVVEHWLDVDEQWDVATRLSSDLLAAGFEAEVFTYSGQDALATWMNDYLADSLVDYVVLLDAGAAAAYAGENDGSLLETWIEQGNGVLWSGYNPFARYVDAAGTESYDGAGQWAADEILDSAGAQLCSGSGAMVLGPDAGDVPDLSPYAATRAVVYSKLGATWSVAKEYAHDGSPATMGDSVLVQDSAGGGEYAQILCLQDRNAPRAEVFRDFFLTHLYASPPPGPADFDLSFPFDGMEDVPLTGVTFAWEQSAGATSWLFELAADPGFESTILVETVIGQPQLTLATTLARGRPYHWRVTARNDHGTALSETFRFRTGTGRKSGGAPGGPPDTNR